MRRAEVLMREEQAAWGGEIKIERKKRGGEREQREDGEGMKGETKAKEREREREKAEPDEEKKEKEGEESNRTRPAGPLNRDVNEPAASVLLR